MTTPLFPLSLISSDVASSLPTGYKLRPLSKDDYSSEFLDVLRDLTRVGDVTKEEFDGLVDFMAGQGKGTYYTIVIEDDQGKVVATGQLLVERKFIHRCGLVGHVEDIAVLKSHQGKSLGKKIIAALDHIADQVGCYKSILDCGEKNLGFYKKCGYEYAASHMARYYESKKAQYKDAGTKAARL